MPRVGKIPRSLMWNHIYIVTSLEKNYLYLPTAGMVTRVGEVLSDMPDNQRHPGPPSWGLGVGMAFSSRKNSISPKPSQRGSYGPKKVEVS